MIVVRSTISIPTRMPSRVPGEQAARLQLRASRRIHPHLRPDEDELRRITDLIAQSIIVLDADGRPLYANRFVLDYFGLALQDVQADGFRERVFHPEDVARLHDE